MTKEKNDESNLNPNLNGDVNISVPELIKLLSSLQTQSSRENAQALAEALSKLQPGYRSPEQKAFDVKLREDQRNIEINKLKARKRRQRYCEHEVGMLGRHRNGEGAFCCLKLSTGEMIGVCQYCQMVISSANPEHQRFFRKANGTPAEAGQAEGLIDPIKAQLARLSPDQRERVLEARAKYFASEASRENVEEEELV